MNSAGKTLVTGATGRIGRVVVDLLRHTSGITYGFYGDSPVRKLYANADMFDGDIDNAQFVERLAKLPLAPVTSRLTTSVPTMPDNVASLNPWSVAKNKSGVCEPNWPARP